jgi:hypothetical protein
MKSKSLLRRTRFLPGESLASLLERLTRLNYYAHPGVIGQICHQHAEHSYQLDNVIRPQSAQTFALLGQLSGIGPEALFAASDHRFAPTLIAPGKAQVFMPWSDGASKQIVTKANVHHQLCYFRNMQFCPLCLQESAYHRLAWTPVAAAVCLQHQCLLLDQCPQCGKKVSVTELINTLCKACEANLRRGPIVSVAGDELGLLSQQAIQHWLSVAPAPVLPPGRTLPNHPPNVMYHLLGNLRQNLTECQDDWSNLPEPLADLSAQFPEQFNRRKRMSPREAYYLYRAALRGVLDWPQGLGAFLDAYSQRNPKTQASSKLHIRLGTFWHWSQKDWQGPEFQFVRHGLVDYLMTRDIPFPQAMLWRHRDVPWFIEQTGLWTPEHAAQALGISIQGLHRFFPNGPLDQCLWPHSYPGQPMFQREKVLSIQRQWKTGLPLTHACYWLGLSEQQVVTLVRLGSLAIECGLDNPDHTAWILNRQSVEAFFEAVTSRLARYPGCPHKLASLYQITYWTSHAGVDDGMLLKGVAEGLLTGYQREPTIRSLANVCFLLAKPFALSDAIYAQRGWISDHTFARQKGISVQVILDWVDAGLIEPVAIFISGAFFESQQIEQLAAEHLPAV